MLHVNSCTGSAQLLPPSRVLVCPPSGVGVSTIRCFVAVIVNEIRSSWELSCTEDMNLTAVLFTAGLDPCAALGFKQVRKTSTTPEFLRNYPSSILNLFEPKSSSNSTFDRWQKASSSSLFIEDSNLMRTAYSRSYAEREFSDTNLTEKILFD